MDWRRKRRDRLDLRFGSTCVQPGSYVYKFHNSQIRQRQDQYECAREGDYARCCVWIRHRNATFSVLCEMLRCVTGTGLQPSVYLYAAVGIEPPLKRYKNILTLRLEWHPSGYEHPENWSNHFFVNYSRFNLGPLTSESARG